MDFCSIPYSNMLILGPFCAHFGDEISDRKTVTQNVMKKRLFSSPFGDGGTSRKARLGGRGVVNVRCFYLTVLTRPGPDGTGGFKSLTAHAADPDSNLIITLTTEGLFQFR